MTYSSGLGRGIFIFISQAIIGIGVITCQPCHANCICHSQQGQALYDEHPWSLMLYHGVSEDNPLLAVMVMYRLNRWPESINSAELAYTLPSSNCFRRLFSPIVGVVQLAANVTVREGKDEPTIYEFEPYIMWRWANFPWNHVIQTSFALAEGVSYVSSIPAIERKYNEKNHTKRLLNYLMFEVTFANPKYPRWQILARIHHRSGAYGLYHAGNSGSNDIGVGIRYLFD